MAKTTQTSAFSRSYRSPGHRSGKNALLTTAAALAVVVLVVLILRSASEVLIPICLATLFSFLLNPLVERLSRWRAPRAFAVVLVVGAVFSGTYFLGKLMFSEMSSLAEDLPRYSDTIRKRVEAVKSLGEGGVMDRLEEVAGVIEDASESVDADQKKSTNGNADGVEPTQSARKPDDSSSDVEPVPVVTKEDDSIITRALSWAAAPLGNFLATLGATVALTFFALLRHDQMRNRIMALAGVRHITMVTRALDEAGSRVSRYLLTQTLINGSYGILLGTGLHFLGLPYAALWGILAFFFRFVPYVGPILVALLPITLGLIVFDDWTHPVGIIVFIATLELATNMIMEPIFYGHSTGMLDIAILVAVMFFTWLWGPVGMVIATPLSVCLVVFSKYVPNLEWVDTLFGGEPELPASIGFYQRLVADDTEEADAILKRHAKAADEITAIDEIALPALSLVRREVALGRLSKSDSSGIANRIQDVSERVLASYKEQGPTRKDHSDDKNDASLCIAWALEAGCDDVALHMLGKAVDGELNFQSLSSQSLMSDWLARIESSTPAAVLLSSTPPSAVDSVKLHIKHLHSRFPDLKIIVGRWGTPDDAAHEEELFAAGATAVFSSFERVLAMLDQLKLVAKEK